jgi:hypothetical protein
MVLALFTNIRLGWKGLQLTNPLAYNENPHIKAIKSFIVQAPQVSFMLLENIYSTGVTYDHHLRSSKYFYGTGQTLTRICLTSELERTFSR